MSQKISLRKANAIQLAIAEQLKENAKASVTVNKYQHIPSQVNEGKKKFENTFNKLQDLFRVLYFIRHKVYEANYTSGVAHLVTELAFLSKQEAAFKILTTNPSYFPGIDYIEKRLADLQNSTTAYSRVDSVEVSVLDKVTVEEFAKTLSQVKKQKQKISDKLLNLNISTEILLDDEEEKVLLEYDLI